MRLTSAIVNAHTFLIMLTKSSEHAIYICIQRQIKATMSPDQLYVNCLIKTFYQNTVMGHMHEQN